MIPRIDATAVASHRAAGARLVDVREPPMYADLHVRGALNIALSGRSAPYWLNVLTRGDEPLVAITATAGDITLAGELIESAERDALGAAVFDAAALSAARLPLASIATITPEALAEENGRVVVDVRDADEWAAGHVPGAIWIPLEELSARIAEVPERAVAAICASGFRSSAAASLLEAAGRSDIANVWGGTTAWQQLGFAVERGSRR